MTTSGSGSNTGDVHGTFFQILPTARLYALFPFCQHDEQQRFEFRAYPDAAD